MTLDAVLEAANVAGHRADAVRRYVAALLEANVRFNLTGARNEEDAAEHVADALDLLPFVCSPLVDIGSGGGFPAVPLAIAAGTECTLIEASRKKAAFLRDVASELSLSVSVVNERAENAGKETLLRERFACGTARAVASAPTVAELLMPFIQVGGAALLQRGELEKRERDALCDAALMLGGRLEKEIPQTGGRRLLVVRKTAPTPTRFPRRVGVPAKRPLCL